MNESKDDLGRNQKLIQLICILRELSQTPRTEEELVSLLSLDRKMLSQDLLLLQRAGFPIVSTNDRWRLVSDYGVPDIDFSSSELLSLLLLYKQVLLHKDEPIYSMAEQALLKIASSLSPEFLAMLANSQSIKVFDDPYEKIFSDTDSGAIRPEDTKPLTFFPQILEAMESQKALELFYKSPLDPGPIKTVVFPYSVFFTRSWYLIGFSRMYHEIRTFKISRIIELKLGSETFKMPVNFSLDSYFGNAWKMIRHDGEDQEIVIIFSKKGAQNVAEIRWHKTQESRFLPDGRVEVRFLVSGLDEIIWWILGYGAEAEVIRPEELRSKISEQIKRMKEVYASNIH